MQRCLPHSETGALGWMAIHNELIKQCHNQLGATGQSHPAPEHHFDAFNEQKQRHEQMGSPHQSELRLEHVFQAFLEGSAGELDVSDTHQMQIVVRPKVCVSSSCTSLFILATVWGFRIVLQRFRAFRRCAEVEEHLVLACLQALSVGAAAHMCMLFVICRFRLCPAVQQMT